MRRFAQHFLINGHAVQRIVDTLELTKTDSVLEIGPGKGVLTQFLVPRAGHVTGVEVDDPLIPFLTRKFAPFPNFTLVHADIMEFDFNSLPPPVKIIGNLPYNLTSPILKKICDATNWTTAVIMVQKEVGDRLGAVPGTTDYGALTVGISLYAEIERIFELSEASFDPRPRVKSCVMRLKRRSKPLSENPVATQKVIQAAFQQRRKTILNSLSHGLNINKEETLALLAKLNIDPMSRAETLSVDTYVAMGLLVQDNKNNPF